MLTSVLVTIAAAAAVMLGWIILAIRKDQGCQQRDLEIARKDALLQKQMAAVPRPDKTGALKRLDDGTA